MAVEQENLEDFDRLLEYLRTTRGFDFTSYKRATLGRRVDKRLQVLNIDGYSSYIDYLQVHPDEFQFLFNTLLINVTSFFRDPDSWEYIRSQIIPQILQSKDSDDQIRVWVAGCASGEEAYTIAILLVDALGMESYADRVKVYATDLDEEALAEARHASYLAKQLETVPTEFVERYFEKNGNDRYVLDRELRRSVIFGKHDLIQDAPISRADLLTCRNALMYFNAEVQERILARFHFALAEGGYLFLGKAETLLTHTDIVTPVELKHRVFQKSRAGTTRDKLLMLRNGHEANIREQNGSKLREAAFDAGPNAQIVVDSAGVLVLVNERARHIFGLMSRDVGRPLRDLEVSYKPVELRSAIDQVTAQRRAVSIKEVDWLSQAGEHGFLNVHLAPLFDRTGVTTAVSISFENVTDFKRLQQELLHFNQELETAYEELQSTNEELQTTNEELQSTVEELETTNEELQSTNEELETMNEELHSANEELETINEELRLTTDQLNRSNAFLNSILGSMTEGVAVVDRDLRVLAWNHKATDLWGLRSEEVESKHLLNLDIGLPVERLRNPIRASQTESPETVELELEATNRRGRNVSIHVTCSPLRGDGGEPLGSIIVMQERHAT